MGLNQSYLGRTYPPTPPYRVGREKIREFATAIGATDPAHFDAHAARALGHPDVVAPPTFPIALTMGAVQALADDADFGLDFSRVVHGDQKFSYHRPVYAGDELSCVTTITEITSRGGSDFLTTKTEVRDAAERTVVTATAKLVVRGDA
jgi:acyl dehydratase